MHASSVICMQHMCGSLRPSNRMALLSAVCEALPEVVAGGCEPVARRAGLPTLLGLVLRALAAAGAAGALLLLRLPCILARVTDQLLDAGKVTALVFGPLARHECPVPRISALQCCVYS